MDSSTSARRQARTFARPLRDTWARLQSGALAAEPLLVLALVGVGLVAHGLNMFHYPSFTFKDDEGIYAAQAWAVLRQGALTPYTYTYDHAPGGWLMLAAWMWLSGGPQAFGGVVDTGRMLMLLLHLAMVPMLYHLARKLGAGVPAAAIATALFSLSPLAVFYQRMVLLDNLMLFWILLSLNLLLDGWGRLSRVVLSGVCFGLAIMCKETAIFLLPVFLFLAFHERWQHQGRFAVGGWLVPMAMVVSWYPLYALLKGELLPAGESLTFVLFSGDAGQVSLIDAVKWQTSRSGGGTMNLGNQFWELVRTDWLLRDPILFGGGALAAVLNVARGLRDRRALVAGLLGIMPLFFLARGGIVFGYYVLFAVPFLCLNLAVLLAPFFARIRPKVGGALSVASVVLLVGGYWYAGTMPPLFQEHPDQAGREALTWIKQNLPAESRIIIRDDLWTDLREDGSYGPAFPNVHSHWKVASDPAIRDGVFENDWQTVDYLITTPEGGLERDFEASNNEVALEARQNAHRVKRWAAEEGSHALHPHQIIELWKVNGATATEKAVLGSGLTYIASRFERNGAYVTADGRVTSEGQAYAMLRYVWTNDRAGFDRVWGWTKNNMLDSRGLMTWLRRDGKIVDPHTAADADTDAALALLMAGKRWSDPELLAAGRAMVRAVWEHQVVTVRGKPYLAAGDWAARGQVLALNPSYFSPYAYHVFAEVDPEHDWLGMIDAGYDLLFAASSAPLGAERSAGLPPDWVGMDRSSGELLPLQLDKGDTTRYGYDAARTYWRVALHLRWNEDGRAENYLRQAGFLRDEVRRILQDGVTLKARVSAVYARNGDVVEEATSVVGSAGAMAALLTLDPESAHTIYAGQILGSSTRVGPTVHWSNPNDLYAQDWGWFATALYADALPNLWKAP